MTHHACAPWALSLTLVFCLLAAGPAGAETPRADLGTGRVVLVPPNLGVRAADSVEAGVEPVWQRLLEHFAAQKRPVTALERTSASLLWEEVMAEIQESEEEAGVYEAYALFATRVAEQLDFETIIFPSLVTRVAKVQGYTAAWDGVRRRVDVPAGGHEHIDSVTGPDLMISREGVRGEIAAASLHVAVFSGKGDLTFEGAGGLSLLQELKHVNTTEDAILAAAERDDAFEDEEQLSEGVEVAFRMPLPASRAR